jgi:hypothetical protein
MTMEIDALYAGLPMRNSLDPCTSCSEWQAQAERVRVLREALLKVASAHAWLAFGECRFDVDRIPTSAEAHKIALKALKL